MIEFHLDDENIAELFSLALMPVAAVDEKIPCIEGTHRVRCEPRPGKEWRIFILSFRHPGICAIDTDHETYCRMLTPTRP